MNKQSYTLTGTTLVRSCDGLTIPFTITLQSADVTRAIKINTDGNEFFAPALGMDETTATRLVYVITAPIVAVQATGVTNDVLSITEM